jgi:hypothetical protein
MAQTGVGIGRRALVAVSAVTATIHNGEVCSKLILSMHVRLVTLAKVALDRRRYAIQQAGLC